MGLYQTGFASNIEDYLLKSWLSQRSAYLLEMVGKSQTFHNNRTKCNEACEPDQTLLELMDHTITVKENTNAHI